MTDVADGFDGQIEIARRARDFRRWPDDVNAWIVAESFQPGVRVADVGPVMVLLPASFQIGAARRGRICWPSRRRRWRTSLRIANQALCR